MSSFVWIAGLTKTGLVWLNSLFLRVCYSESQTLQSLLTINKEKVQDACP